MSPIFVSLLLTVAAGQPANIAADTALVCPNEFRAAMQPWIDLRTSQGHTISVLSNLGSAEEIRGQILGLTEGGKLRFVLLIGDADAAMYTDAAVRARSLPMHYSAARVNVKWGSTPTIPTDNWYVQRPGTSDESPVPSLAIGRLPAASVEELSVMVKKIVDYERSTDFGPWRKRVNFIAGVGNFGFLADAVLESTARTLLTENIPAEYHVSMTYGNWRSPYCPDPRRFHAMTVARLDEGSLFWVYIGHAAPLETARLGMPGGTYPVLTSRDAVALSGVPGRPIALFLCCYAGALDARGRCLASKLAASPGGPVAVLAGSRVTMPYAMTVMATSLTGEFFHGNCPTLGEALLHAKQNMLKEPDKTDTRRALLDSIAAVISPSAKDLATERAEHVRMFNLIGDPLLTLRHPRPIEVRTSQAAVAGGSVMIDGTSPIDGMATVELVLRRDRFRGERPSRDVYPAIDKELAAFDDVYHRANDQQLARRETAIHAGQFHAQLEIPTDAAGACHVCVFVAGNGNVAMGSTDINIAKPGKPTNN